MVSIATLKTYPPKTPIPGLRGTITRLGHQEAVQTASGTWKYQSLTLDDGTGSIELFLSDREAVGMEMVGKEVILSPGSPNSLRTDIDKRGRQRVRVTASAFIGPVVDSTAQGQPPQPQTPPAVRPPSPGSTAVPKDWSEVRKIAWQGARAMFVCIQAAKRIADELAENGIVHLDDEQIKQTGVAIYISILDVRNADRLAALVPERGMPPMRHTSEDGSHAATVRGAAASALSDAEANAAAPSTDDIDMSASRADVEMVQAAQAARQAGLAREDITGDPY